MTDRDFDNVLRDALTSEEVPSELNRTLFERVQKRHKAKVLTFIKSASAVAAVFICAVAVLSYYNSGSSRITEESISTEKDIVITDAERENTPAVTKAETSEKVSQSPQPRNKKIPEKDEAASAAEPSMEVSSEAMALPEEDTSTPFSMARGAAPMPLSALFVDGYDYKSVIDSVISSQIDTLPHASQYVFKGIDGSESFSLSEENSLTIVFPAGSIISEEHGEQYFTVGTLTDGMLK